MNESRTVKPIIQYEYFVLEEEKSIKLLTFIWYAPQKCNMAQLVAVNSFNKSSGQWQHGNFKIDRFYNFYGCQINFLFEGGLPKFRLIEVDHKNKAIRNALGMPIP